MSDLISRQAAIDICRAPHMRNADCSDFEMAIMMLPPAELGTNLAEVGTDCIGRQAAIETVMECYDNDELFEVYEDKLRELPPAQPERIKGHWIESNGLNILMKKFIEKGETWRACDKCGAGFMIGYQYECDKLYHETFHNFCPKCGAEMEVTT